MDDDQAILPGQLHIVSAARQLWVGWGDGHATCLPWWYLRGWCPCATCQGHGGTPAYRPPADVPDLADVREVGHYALNMVWRDGHNTGIYPFALLRRLCACGPCRRRADTELPWRRLPANDQDHLSGEVDAASRP